jgi:DNA polymerase alpha-associated DNA helicase A
MLMGYRMNQTMTRLQKMQEGDYSMFVRTLFGLTSPSPAEEVKLGTGEGELQWVDEGLNDSQKEAICFALGSREVALIHGPPGVSFHFLVNAA